MKKKILTGVFFAVAVATIVIATQIAAWQRRQHNILQYVQADEIISSLNDGDIILRLGDRFWSRIFKDLSPNERRFSHMGIVRIRGDTVSVIHAEGLAIQGMDSVNEVSLTEFLNSALSAGVYRLRYIDGAKISDLALEYIGFPFDWQFDKTDNSRLYCTELLYVILKRINPDIRLNLAWVRALGRNIIPLDVVLQTEYFMRIGHWGR